jgi:hypothetical protein
LGFGLTTQKRKNPIIAALVPDLAGFEHIHNTIKQQ